MNIINLNGLKPYTKVVSQTSTVSMVDTNEICFGAGSVLVRMNLDTLTQKCLIGADANILSVVTSTDGLMISGSVDGGIRFWKDNRSILLIKTSVQARFMKVIGSSLIICGRSTKLGSSFTSITIWNISKVGQSENAVELCRGSTDQVVHSLESPFNNTQLRFCTGGINGVRIWRTRKLNHLRSAPVDFQKHACTEIKATAWGEEYLYAAGINGTIFRIDADNLKVADVHQLIYNLVPTTISALYALNNQLIVGSENGNVRVWSSDLTDVKLEIELKGKIEAIQSAQFKSEETGGASCLISSSSKSIGLLNINDSKYRTIYRAHAGEVLHCAISDQFMASATATDLRVWKLREADYTDDFSLVQIFELDGKSDRLTCLTLHKNVLALGLSNGNVQVYSIDDTGSNGILDKKIHRGLITDIHFSPSGLLFSIDSCGDVAVYNSECSISRVVRDGTYPREANKIASSPEGRFIAVLANRSKHNLEIYSSQLDPLTTLTFENNIDLCNWCFIDNSSVLVLADNRSIYQYQISSQKCFLRQKEIHFTNSKIFLDCIPKTMTFSASKDSLKCWVGNMKREKPQEYFVHHKINSIFTNGKYLVSGGDSVILWKCLAPEADDVCRNREHDVIIYDDEKVETNQPTGALFNAIEVFDNTLSADLQPRSQDAPSPILREDDNIESEVLDITPIDTDSESISEPEKCSSPILPHVVLNEQEPITESSSMVKIMRNCKISEKARAKEINLPKSRLIPRVSIPLPTELFLPDGGENACELIRTVSFYGTSRNNCIWAQKRGELIYSSGGFLVQETILNSCQKFITSDPTNCNIVVMSLSADESRLAYSQLTPTGCSLQIVNLNDSNTSKAVTHQHTGPIHCVDWSRDNRWILSISGDYSTSIELNSSWDGQSFGFNEYDLIINDAKFASNDIFVTAGDELRYWEISDSDIITYDVELIHELRDDMFSCMSVSADYSTLALGSQNGVISIWLLNGFQLQYFFPIGAAEINSISLQNNDTIVMSSGNRVQFWDVSHKSAITADTFPLLQEFELDDQCLSLSANCQQAVVGTINGSIYYLSIDGSNELVTSTSSMTDFAELGNYIATAHSNGSVKIWQPNYSRAWHLVVQFQAKQSVHCVSMSPGTLVAGYDNGLIRIFSINKAEMKCKINAGNKAILKVRMVAGNVLSGTIDGRIFIHDAATGHLIKQFNDHIQSKITNIDYCPGQNQPLPIGGKLWCVSSYGFKI